MATYYVSNLALNGYSLGVDTNNGTSITTPFLTIAHAVSVMATTGDTCIINPTSTSATSANHPYVETSGSGYLDLGAKKNTIQADPAYTASYFVVIQSSSGARVINSSDASATMGYLIDLVLDCQGTTSKSCITPHSTGNFTYTRCKGVNATTFAAFLNIATGGTTSNYFINQYTNDSTFAGQLFIVGGANGNVTVDRSTWSSAQQMFTTGSGTNVTLKGGTYSNTTTNLSAIVFGVAATTSGNFTLTAGSDGSRATFPAGTYFPVQFAGIVGQITMNSFDITNTLGGVTFPLSDATLSIPTAAVLTNFTFTMGTNTTNGMWFGANENTACPSVSGATLTNSSTTLNVDPLYINNGFGAAVIYNNTVVNNGGQHSIAVGNDGFHTDVQNIVTTTGNKNLGDTSANTYVDQFLTTTAITYSHYSYLGSFIVNLLKTGSPTGTINCSCYLDNAGVPGTLVETASTVLSASSLTTSAQPFQFNFANRTKVNPSTKVHLVLSYTGTIDGTNYVLIQENTTVTAGSILTSANGTSWTTDTTHALLFGFLTGPYGITDCLLYKNTVSTTNTTIETHMLALFCVTRGKIYQNIQSGGSIGFLLKLTKGSSTAKAQAFDNLFFSSSLQGGAAGYTKAAQYATIYNNTFIISGSASTGTNILVGPDSQQFNGVTIVNEQQADQIIIQNNILINQVPTASNIPVYFISANGLSALPTNLTINNNDVWNPNGQPICNLYSTWTLWQGAGYDTAGINTDPLLTNETTPTKATDFIPLSTSPVKAAGSINGAAPFDYTGNPFFLTPDIGAYSISYIVQQAVLGYSYKFNAPFTGNFDIAGVGTKAAALFSPLQQVVPIVGSVQIPSIAGQNITILANASSGNIIVTVPTTVIGSYVIKKTDATANTVTVTPASGLIDGGSSVVLSIQNTAVDLVSDGSNLDITNPIPADNILSVVTLVNSATVATTVLYTVPTGKILTVTKVAVRALTGVTTGHTANVYTTTPGDIFASTVIAGLNAVNKVFFFTSTGMSLAVPAGGVVNYQITTGGVGNVTITLFGFLQ